MAKVKSELNKVFKGTLRASGSSLVTTVDSLTVKRLELNEGYLLTFKIIDIQKNKKKKEVKK